jgi:hydrogenase maturation protease
MVFGIGRPHGDDYVGCLVVELLHARGIADAVAVSNPSDLFRYFPDCRLAIVVDGCVSGRRVGSILRLDWPQERPDWGRRESTHGIGVGDALSLAESLGVLPREVILYGIEIRSAKPSSPVCAAVREAAGQVAGRIERELEVRGMGCDA